MLTEYKKYYLSVNGKQSVKLEEGTIESENYFKQISVPLKIYADFNNCIILMLILCIIREVTTVI